MNFKHINYIIIPVIIIILSFIGLYNYFVLRNKIAIFIYLGIIFILFILISIWDKYIYNKK